MTNTTRDFLIRRDHNPMKVLRMDPHRIARFMKRLQSRFPDYSWSVSERFLLNAGD